MIFKAEIPHLVKFLIIAGIIWYIVRLITRPRAYSNISKNDGREKQPKFHKKEDNGKHILPDIGEEVDYEEVDGD